MKHDGTSRTIWGNGFPEDSTSVNLATGFRRGGQLGRASFQAPVSLFAFRLQSTPGRRAWNPAHALSTDL
jgi:hypothetical protein